VYLRHRFYNPLTGRFITEDPIFDGFNWYIYANNNPLMFFDPLGLAAETIRGFVTRHGGSFSWNDQFGTATFTIGDRRLVTSGAGNNVHGLNIWNSGDNMWANTSDLNRHFGVTNSNPPSTQPRHDFTDMGVGATAGGGGPVRNQQTFSQQVQSDIQNVNRVLGGNWATRIGAAVDISINNLHTAVGVGASMLGMATKIPDNAFVRRPNTNDASGFAGDSIGIELRTVPTLPANARILTGPDAPSRLYPHLERFHGIPPHVARERLHAIKDAAHRGPADNIILDWTGNVFDPVTRQWLGSLTSQ